MKKWDKLVAFLILAKGMALFCARIPNNDIKTVI